MAAKTPKSLADLLSGGSLGNLGAEARRRRDLTEQVRAVLPPEAADHLLSASPGSGNELVLTMDSAVWAARVRYLAEALGDTRRVRVRVRPVA